MSAIVNIQSFPDVRQGPVGGIEKHVFTDIILRSYPLPLQDSPKRLCDVQVRGVWGRKKMKRPLFSHIGLNSFIHLLRCTVALSSTTKVSLPMRKEKSSRKLTILPAVIRSVVVNPSY